jgi:hypothetical protein
MSRPQCRTAKLGRRSFAGLPRHRASKVNGARVVGAEMANHIAISCGRLNNRQMDCRNGFLSPLIAMMYCSLVLWFSFVSHFVALMHSSRTRQQSAGGLRYPWKAGVMTLKPLKEFSSLFDLFSSLIAAKAVSSIYKIAPEDCASRLFQWLAYGFILRQHRRQR